jgi:tripartite-type tricarboxylate transporter receptor subunit TctC
MDFGLRLGKELRMSTRLGAAVLAAGLWAVPAAAQEDVAAFYRGKTLRIVVGVAVGSGYEINARLLARHLGAHLPGNPTIIVQNQPGAGSVTMHLPRRCCDGNEERGASL